MRNSHSNDCLASKEISAVIAMSPWLLPFSLWLQMIEIPCLFYSTLFYSIPFCSPLRLFANLDVFGLECVFLPIYKYLYLYYRRVGWKGVLLHEIDWIGLSISWSAGGFKKMLNGC